MNQKMEQNLQKPSDIFNIITKILTTIIALTLIITVNNMNTSKSKNPNVEKVEQIQHEIPLMISPYQIIDTTITHKIDTTIIQFKIKGDYKDWDKLDVMLKKNGFNKGCRNGESLRHSVTHMLGENYILIKWKYPTKSCY